MPWLHPETLQRFMPAEQHQKNCWQQRPLPARAVIYLSRDNSGKHRHLSSTQRISRGTCQCSSTHSHERAASAYSLKNLCAAQPVKNHKIQDTCQWRYEGSHQWHSFHNKGDKGGSLTHIPIHGATDSTSTSSKAGRGLPETHILQLQREPASNK